MALIRTMGCLTPWGVGPAPAVEALEQRRGSVVRPIPAAVLAAGRAAEGPSGDPGPRALPDAGWIDPLPRPGPWIGRRPRFSRLDRLTRLVLEAAHQAGAGIPGGASATRPLVGVALGTAHGSHLANEQFLQHLDRTGAGSPSLFAYTLPSSAAGEVSILLGLQGPLVTLAQGAGSGLAALGAAAALIRQGAADWMLAGAADTLGPTLLRAAGEGGGELAEGAVFFGLAARGEGQRALARVGGWSRARGSSALERACGQALDQAGVEQESVPRLWPGGPLSHDPLLAICQVLLRGASLPALVCARDAHDGVDALCLTAP